MLALAESRRLSRTCKAEDYARPSSCIAQGIPQLLLQVRDQYEVSAIGGLTGSSNCSIRLRRGTLSVDGALDETIITQKH